MFISVKDRILKYEGSTVKSSIICNWRYRLNHLRLATLFLILTVLAALHTSIFGGGYNTLTMDNITVATTISTPKSINTSVDDDNDGETPIRHEQNNTAIGDDNDEDGSGKELPVSPPLIL